MFIRSPAPIPSIGACFVMREGEHRLGDEDGVAPNGIRDAHPESQVPGLAGQIAQ
jgi:hypothetical protein